MPAHHHGMNFDVDVNQIAKGDFEFSNVLFHMPGVWEIQIAAEIDGAVHKYRTLVELELIM